MAKMLLDRKQCESISRSQSALDAFLVNDVEMLRNWVNGFDLYDKQEKCLLGDLADFNTMGRYEVIAPEHPTWKNTFNGQAFDDFWYNQGVSGGKEKAIDAAHRSGYPLCLHNNILYVSRYGVMVTRGPDGEIIDKATVLP